MLFITIYYYLLFIIYCLLCRFLRWHYYVAFKDDPELPFLISIGLFSTPDSDRQPLSLSTGKINETKTVKTTTASKLNKDKKGNDKEINMESDNVNVNGSVAQEIITVLHPSILKKRLEMFLRVFAAVISPKQLYLHQQLFDYYTSILARSETNIVKVAYDCILGYKPPYLMPVRENVRRLLDDKKIRDELVVFDPSIGGDGARTSRSSAAVDEGQLGVSHISILSSLILSYPILSYLILSYLILSYLILSYLILSYLILSYLILSYLILTDLILSYPI